MEFFRRSKLKKLKAYWENEKKWESKYPKTTFEQECYMDALEFAIAFYEGRTATKSLKDYLEIWIDNPYNSTPKSEEELKKNNIRRDCFIRFLYNWVYYNKISGF